MKYLNTDTGELIEFKWKTPYNHDTDLASLETSLACADASLAQQHQKEEADINVIFEKFKHTGLLPQIEPPPALEQFGEIFDMQTALNTIAEAKASFMQLDANTRSAFNNDPHTFVATVDGILSDTDDTRRGVNMSALRAMGLAIEPGPKADATTLGDVLKAIQEANAPRGLPTPQTPQKPGNGLSVDPADTKI